MVGKNIEMNNKTINVSYIFLSYQIKNYSVPKTKFSFSKARNKI